MLKGHNLSTTIGQFLGQVTKGMQTSDSVQDLNKRHLMAQKYIDGSCSVDLLKLTRVNVGNVSKKGKI